MGRRAGAGNAIAAIAWLCLGTVGALGATFVEKSSEAGIDFVQHSGRTESKYLIETMGGGVAVLDFDGDGWLDILLVNGGSIQAESRAARVDRSAPELQNRLFRNERDGTFSDVTADSGLAQDESGIYGMGVATADYDNDGWTDVLITGYGGARLYRNEAGRRFRDVTAQSGISVPGWSASAGFADLNADGLLDLVVTRYLDWSFDRHVECGTDFRQYCPPDRHDPVTSKLFENLDGRRFRDVSAASGIEAMPGKALGVAFHDIEPDGDLDVVIANDAEPQQLLRNLGGMRFEDCALETGVAYNEDGGRFAGMGVEFEDYDNDGRADILITNLARELYALYRNEAEGLFAYRTRGSRLAAITAKMSGWGVRLADFDLDGWKDVFVAQGHVLDTIERSDPGLLYRQPPLLAKGGEGRFTDISDTAGPVFAEPAAGRGAASGDLDNDGDLDLVVSVLDGRPMVLYNDASSSGRHWIALRLVGTSSPRDGQGARVTVRTTDETEQHRIATTAGSYLSASDARVHFGLSTSEALEWIRIRWPSGSEQWLRDVDADQVLTVEEDSAAGD